MQHKLAERTVKWCAENNINVTKYMLNNKCEIQIEEPSVGK